MGPLTTFEESDLNSLKRSAHTGTHNLSILLHVKNYRIRYRMNESNEIPPQFRL